MDTTNQIISSLQSLRSDLRQTLGTASLLEIKLHGPRPSDAGEAVQSTDTVRSIIDDYIGLTEKIRKSCDSSHSTIGEFAPIKQAQMSVGANNRSY